MAFLVDIVFWGVLTPLGLGRGLPMHKFFNFYSYNQHALNLVFIVVEFFLNQIPVYKIHVFVVLMWASLYGIFTFISNAYIRVGWYACG